MKVRRYTVDAWVTFDVPEGKTAQDVLGEMEALSDNAGWDSVSDAGLYIGFPDQEPTLEDERED